MRQLLEQIQPSLSHKVLLWLGFPIIAFSSVGTIVAYQQIMEAVTRELSGQLQVHTQERVKRESLIFQTAKSNHQILKEKLLKQLKAAYQLDPDVQLNKLIYPWSDGSYRSLRQLRSKQQSLQEFDDQNRSSIFIGSNVKLTRQLKQEILLFQNLNETFGPAWHPQFINLWISSTENISTGYWPGSPWIFDIPPAFDSMQEEYAKIAEKVNNPDRTSNWTNLFFDVSSNRWMVSLVTPVDDARGRHVASIGHDIVLTDLIHRIDHDTFPNSRNILISKKGYLLVDSQHQAAIQQAGGKLSIASLQDSSLERVWKEAIGAQSKNAVQNSVYTTIVPDSLILTAPIQGTDWYFVTLYPKSALHRKTWNYMLPVIVLALIVVTLEVVLIYAVLRRQIHHPLANLLNATRQLSLGYFNVELDSTRKDEVGELSRSFTTMAQALEDSFEHLETQVEERTQDLSNTLNELKMTQAQLVQSEKMSSLGQMVAGIAHEINNPVSFIHGNLKPAKLYIESLLAHLQLYKTQASPEEIQEHAEDIDLPFLVEDLSKLIGSMTIGTGRIRAIVLSLRNFSRLDESDLKTVDLHEGIDSTLLILNHRLKTGTPELIKQYGPISLLDCYPSQLNQVIMNLLANSIDALEEFDVKNHDPDWIPTITIATEQVNDEIILKIQDNGPGIPEAIQNRIFDPFFTTKDVGKGTGLGLSISHQIITAKHQGQITCLSGPAIGTTFKIVLPIRHAIG